MDPVIPHHPRGGPFPHLQHGYHAELPRVIQHTRGLIHAGTEPMEVGRFILEQAHALALGVDDLRCALGFLLSAAITAGGLAVIRSRLQFSVSAADAGELMNARGALAQLAEDKRAAAARELAEGLRTLAQELAG